MNKEPETYEELIRQRRCVDLTKHYNLSKEDLQKIYEFLEKNPKGTVVGDKEKLTLKGTGEDVIVIVTSCISSFIDGVNMSNDHFTAIKHYEPSSSYSSGSSGGFSSNNNNNNRTCY